MVNAAVMSVMEEADSVIARMFSSFAIEKVSTPSCLKLRELIPFRINIRVFPDKSGNCCLKTLCGE